MRQILERHLLVGNEFSIANLTEQGRDNYLQTIRGKVKITIVESGGGKRSFRIDFIQIFSPISSGEKNADFVSIASCLLIATNKKRMERSQLEVKRTHKAPL